MALYTCSAVQELIDKYLDRGGRMIEMREGVLGYGNILLVADGCKTTVITEVALNEWSSAHKIRMYNKIPAKYQRFVDAQ